MSGLLFEANSNNNFSDVFVLTGSGAPLDITASVDQQIASQGGGDGAVPGYASEPLFADGGSELFGASGVVYFNGWWEGQQDLYVYNQSTGKLSEIAPANSWGSGVNPEDFVSYNNTVYFAGDHSNGYQELYATNGTASGTASVSNSWVDNGQMAAYNSLLFFDGQTLTQTSQGYVTGTEDLVSYNAKTGAFVDVSKGAANVSTSGFNPQDTTSALSSGLFQASEQLLFMAGIDKSGHQNLFSYNGSTFTEVAGGAAGGIDPLDITAVQTNIPISTLTLVEAGVYFSGVDSKGERGLFYSDGQSNFAVGAPQTTSATEVTASSVGGNSQGLDPYDITAFKGNVYFTGYDNRDGPSGRGLFEYNPTTGKTSELIASNVLDLGHPYQGSWGNESPITMSVYNNELYFAASNPNAGGAASVDQLYAYSGSGAAPTHFVTGSSLNSTPGPAAFGSF